ncbi:1-acyl-sn-glycerol-3-phosphate acyltransferase [Vicingaceae bacterium]|nr:1-acyl-sn-glycerol-3-phosphate acyltransferase [Vicingaceae bacterium]
MKEVEQMEFEDIRPLHDNEVKEGIARLLNVQEFKGMVDYAFQGKIPFEQIEQQLRQITTVKQFQSGLITKMLGFVIAKTSESFTFSGLENLEKGKAYLFLSTHRDIVLDSALMNLVLNDNDYDTARIAIGDNLVKEPWINDLVRLNKSFIVKRGKQGKDKVMASMQLSKYIAHSILNDNESVWIAQREGRTKDGIDKTQPGLIKMLSIAGRKAPVEHLRQLNIVPVTISYEYNPCDALLLPELLAKSEEREYVKGPMEDLISMMKGIEGKKGRIHLSFGDPLNSIGNNLVDVTEEKFVNQIVDLVDHEVYKKFQLFPTNFIADDLLNQQTKWANNYTTEEKETFKKVMTSRLAAVEGDPEKLKNIYLKMYANPVIKNKEE